MADESQKWVLMVTAKGPMNMSVIKYWGKRNEELVLPVNDSISISFDTDDMCAHTTIAVSPTFDQDRLWLNGKEHSLDTIRFQSVLRELRGRATDFYDKKKGIKITKEDWQKLHLHIGSVNNFPTAAGLASSAAGFATLVFAGANLMNLKEDRCQLSAIARLGSGSACRGLFAGFQKWNMGTDDKGSDCFAYQLYDENYWPDLVTVIAVVSSRQKEVSSKKGMVESADSSLFLQYRAKEVVPKRRARMEEALKNRDFTTFAHITNVESNQFHAVCLDTYPPLFYLNDNSRRIINIIEYWNRAVGEPQACYTYDAGPNGVLFARNRKAAGELIRKLLYHFPPNPDTDVNSMFVGDESIIREVGVKSHEDVQKLAPPPESRDPTLQIRGGITHFICTKPGRGPQLITDESEFLLDPETGFPK